jgi:hypothetical protein
MPCGPNFAGHALRDGAQPRLGSAEMSEAWLAAQAGRSAGEKHGSAPQWREATRRFAADKKSAEATDAPELLEGIGAQLAEIEALVVTGVVDDKVRRMEPDAG